MDGDVLMGENVIQNKTFKFSVRIIKLYKYLCMNKREYILSRQVLRSGTSIGANVKEAIYAQSTKDFVSKFSIALKEASETEYWLDLLIASNYIEKEKCKEIKAELLEINKIITSIIVTSKKNIKN
jgi:four helix bundle protein